MIIFDKVVELKKIVPRELKFDEFKRYSRQLILPDLGRKGTGLHFFLLCNSCRFLGQENLLNSSVLIVGCGGLGCPVIQYLAAAGIGRIGLVDFDTGKNCHVQDFVSQLAEKR